jgi:hypothetical protein
MVGRPDTGSYGVFPPAGAELLRRLHGGTTIDAGARWWNDETGERLDVEDFLEIIEDLGFVVADGVEPTSLPRVRWQRLGGWLFSLPAWLVYAALVASGALAMVLDSSLRPSYRNFFFTDHLSLIPITLALGQIPLLLLHEGYHAVAARRRGLPSTLGIGRRYYYLVAETRLDSLYSLPRRQRYLPFFAGALIDTVGVAAFTLAAAASRHCGAAPWLSGLALAFALSGVLRIVWQGMFYLETDVYFAINTATGCADLHGAATYRLRGWRTRLLRRDPDPARGSREDWSEREHAAARWYAALMVAGYGLSTATLLLVALPAAWRFWTTVFDRMSDPGRLGVVGLLDTFVFVALSLGELGLLAYVTIRDRRSSASQQSSISGEEPL